MQLDFGGFDPAFVGVTLRFDSLRAWKFLQRFKSSAEPVELNRQDQDERFEALSVASVLSHEIRHFHDFLMSPYSARIFKLRIQLLLNLLQVIQRIVNSDANCLPLPLFRWCALDKASRLEALKWANIGGNLQPPHLPHLTQTELSAPIQRNHPDDFANLLKAVYYLRERIRELTFNPDGVHGDLSFQPWQVYELSALLIQIQEIWHTYGQQDTEFFCKRLIADDTAYSRTLRLALDVWRAHGRLLDPDVTTAIVTWSLLGSYETDKWNADPTYRFARACNQMLANGPNVPGDGVQDWFAFWSSTFGLSTVKEGLAESRKLFATAHAIANSLHRSGISLLAEYQPLLSRVTSGVLAAHDRMSHILTTAPETYVTPQNYLENSPHFVNPTVRVTFDGAGLQLTIPKSEFEAKGYIVEWARQIDGEELIVSVLEPYSLSPFAFLSPHDVQEFATLIGVTDFLVADQARVIPEVQFPGRSFFANSRIAPFEVF